MSARMHLSGAHEAQQQDDGTRLAVAAEVLGLLADRTRLALLQRLARGEADVTTLFQTAATVDPGTLADPVIKPDGALFVFVEKRELVKDPTRENTINQSVEGMTQQIREGSSGMDIEDKTFGVLVLVFQRKIVSGLTAGAVKG